MEKKITALEASRSFGQILEDILARGDNYVVERQGTPIAVVVPIEVYEQWKHSRERFFDMLGIAQSNANMSAEEADELAAEVIKAIRVK